MVEKILSYFGTYTPAADGAAASFKVEYLTSLGIAALVIFLGHALVSHSKLLRKFAIPAPVVSGLLVSIVIALIKGPVPESVLPVRRLWLQHKDAEESRREVGC